MGCCAWFGILVYVTLNLAVLLLATVAIAGNYWVDVRGQPTAATATVRNAGLWHVCWNVESTSERRPQQDVEGVPISISVNHDGSWFDQWKDWWTPEDSNESEPDRPAPENEEAEPRTRNYLAEGANSFYEDLKSFFRGDPSNGCSGDVEEVYRDIWGSDYWGYVQATRAFSIAFASVALIKLFVALWVWYRNSNPLGKSIGAKRLVLIMAFVQFLFGLVVVGVFTALYIQVAHSAPEGIMDQPKDYWGWCYWAFVGIAGVSLIDMIVLCC